MLIDKTNAVIEKSDGGRGPDTKRDMMNVCAWKGISKSKINTKNESENRPLSVRKQTECRLDQDGTTETAAIL